MLLILMLMLMLSCRCRGDSFQHPHYLTDLVHCTDNIVLSIVVEVMEVMEVVEVVEVEVVVT